MDASVFVEDARHWAKRLVVSEMQGPCDHGPAMRRVARQIGVRWTLLKNLHYRIPSDVGTSEFAALGEAYEQRKLYRAEREGYAPKSSLGRLLVRAADTLVGEKGGEPK